MRYVALLGGGGLLLLFIMVAHVAGSPALAPEELVRRCEVCQPAWNGYQEDIKEIGAGPVAQWQGRPLSLRISGKTVYLTMMLGAPWSEWEAAIPLLLKTPEGQVFRSVRYAHQAEGCVYEFDALTSNAPTLPPWLDIQYPHTRKRLHLDGDGHWQVADTSVK